MRQNILLWALLAISPLAIAQTQAGSEQPGKNAARTFYFTNAASLNLAQLLAPPPNADSLTTQKELTILHQIERTRTLQQVAVAQEDDQEQDIFIFRDVLGQDFSADKLPVTAALSHRIHGDESVITKSLKTAYSRPRPFQSDAALKPVCALTKEPNSYPSGHTVSGYLFALTLVQMVPEKQAQIMQRVEEYTQNRLICGVHYPSDIEAGRDLAYFLFGRMLESPQFQRDLSEARDEVRSHMGLPKVTLAP